jgi:hypothetical protein
MFAPSHSRAATELLRVCRPGGRIGLANWTPSGFIGQLLRTVGRHVPPPANLTPPTRWGTEDHLDALFARSVAGYRMTSRDFVFRYRSPAHFVDVFRSWYGPVHKAFASLTDNKQAELERDIVELIAIFNQSFDSTVVIPAEYVEVVISR